MTTPALNFDILQEVFLLNKDDIPTLRNIALTCICGRDIARQHMFKFVCLPVQNDYLQDVFATVEDKPYITIRASVLRLKGVRSSFLNASPMLDMESVDEALGRFTGTTTLSLEGFQWMRSDEVLVNARDNFSLSMQSVYGHGRTGNPIELISAFTDLLSLSISDMRLDAIGEQPVEIEGHVSALVVTIDFGEEDSHNPLDALDIHGVAELSCKSMRWFHVPLVQLMLGMGNNELLSKLTIWLPSDTWPSAEWEDIGLSDCIVLEELIIVIELIPGEENENEHQQTVLHSLLQDLPPSLRYLDIVFTYRNGGRMLSYSAVPAGFEWEEYRTVLTDRPSMRNVGLSIVHDEGDVRWSEDDEGRVKAKMEGVPLSFYVNTKTEKLSWWY